MTVAGLPAVPGVTYLDNPDEVIFSLITTRVEEVEEAVAEGEPAEPEVVGRAKEEEEEE